MGCRTIGALAALLLCGAAGCTEHVAYVHDTVLGIDLTLATEGTTRLVFGYDSDTFAIVPGFRQGADPAEAMTLVSVSRVEAEGLDDIIFNHWIATGTAGRKAAVNPATLQQMREAVFGAAAQTQVGQ